MQVFRYFCKETAMQAGFPLLLQGKPTSGRARRACRLVFPYFYEEKLACKLVFLIFVEEIASPESRLEGSAAAGELRDAIAGGEEKRAFWCFWRSCGRNTYGREMAVGPPYYRTH